MIALKITCAVLDIAGFLAWLGLMYRWIKRGCPIPRRIHMCALCFFLAGLALFVYMFYFREFSFWISGLWIIFPPMTMYLGWLRLSGPDENN